VKNVYALRDEIAARGAKIVQEPTDMEHGMRELWVDDPDGNAYRFASDVVSKLKIERTSVEIRLEERLAALGSGAPEAEVLPRLKLRELTLDDAKEVLRLYWAASPPITVLPASAKP
jgi:hypothetical protein